MFKDRTKKIKRCPYCGEEILAIAKKCKHCGEWLHEEKTAQQASKRINNKDIESTQETIEDDFIPNNSPSDNGYSEECVSDSLTTKSKLPGKEVIIKIVSAISIMAITIFFLQYCDNKIPSIEGTWTYGIEETWQLDNSIWSKEDNIILKYNHRSIDSFNKDKSEIDKGTITFSLVNPYFKANNISLEDTLFTATYEITYKGTWKQDKNNITLTGTSCEWQLIDGYYNSTYDEAVFEKMIEGLDSLVNVSCEEDINTIRTQTIVNVDYKANTITVEEDGDEFVMEKEGKIKNDGLAALFRLFRSCKGRGKL